MEFSVQQGGNTNGAMSYPVHPFPQLLATPTAPPPIELQANNTPTQQGQASNR